MNPLLWLHETFSFPAVLAVIGAVISAGAALWASYDQTKTQNANDIQAQEIKTLNTQILALSEENKRLANEGISSITGGNGFVHVDILKGWFPDAFAAVVTANGQYPQYDLSIRFFDEYKDHMQQVINPLVINIATLPAGQTTMHRIPAFDLNGKTDLAKFNIFISARNGSFIQELRLRKINNEWYSAFRVYKKHATNDEKTLLLEEAMDQYPRNKDNSLVW